MIIILTKNNNNKCKKDLEKQQSQRISDNKDEKQYATSNHNPSKEKEEKIQDSTKKQ